MANLRKCVINYQPEHSEFRGGDGFVYEVKYYNRQGGCTGVDRSKTLTRAYQMQNAFECESEDED